MRIAHLAIVFCALAAMGAARQHASKKDLDACKLEASQASKDSLTDQSRNSKDPDILDIADCMKMKGYIRVEDSAGICEVMATVECFERP